MTAPVQPAATPVSLTQRLQDVTERLAATQTQQDIFQVVLQPALESLCAVAGAVLLTDHAEERLVMAATRGYEEGAQTIWQDGPLTGNVPAGDALQRHEALYFEHQGDLVRAYPELEERTGAIAPVANAVLPMFLSHRPVGVLILDFREPHEFSEEEKHFLQTLAAQCAIALDRARLLTDLQGQLDQRTRQIEQEARAHQAFVAFTEATSTSTDVNLLARQAISLLSDYFPDGSGLYCVRQAEGRWVGQVWSEHLPANIVEASVQGFILEPALIEEALDTGRPVFYDHWQATDPRLTAQLGQVMLFCAPLTLRGEVEALLFFGGPQQDGGWDEQDRVLVRAIARSLNLALERAGQASYLLARRKEAEKRSEVLATFAELSRELVLDTDPYGLIGRTQEVTLGLLSAGFCGYFEPQGHHWTLRTHTGRMPAAVQSGGDGRLTADFPALSICYGSGEAYYQRPAVPPFLPGETALPAACAALPVMVSGQTRGVLLVTRDAPGRWNREERAILDTVCHQLQLALERAEQTQRLHEQNSELEAFTYSVSHDLRTPIRHIMGFNRLLRGSLGEDLDPKSERYLNVIEDATVRMNTLIDAMLGLSRTARATLNPGQVDLGRLVDEVRRELETEAEQREVVWQVAALPTVTGDHDTLYQAVVNLLSNALKYTRTRPVTRIDIWAEERPHEWAVMIRDNGVGFDPRYADRLFGVFQRLHRADEFEGTGVGLANVKRIIARHGGTVLAESVPGEGATFSFTLPRLSESSANTPQS